MRAEVILVRHAQPLIPSPDGPDDYHRPLTEAGIAQADRLVEDLTRIRPSLIASSPYLRAIQTVEPTARAMGMPVQCDHDLREWDSGLEPTPDYARHYAESWANPHFARPSGESLQQLTDRATAILRSLARQHPNRTVVVGSHGTFIARALIGFGLTTIDWPFSRAMPMPAIYRLHFSDRGTQAIGPGL
ncbi:histidine phosphatase family protein [Actinosynnema sp. NPDC051121]